MSSVVGIPGSAGNWVRFMHVCMDDVVVVVVVGVAAVYCGDTMQCDSRESSRHEICTALFLGQVQAAFRSYVAGQFNMRVQYLLRAVE